MADNKNKRGLGRGLSALMSDVDVSNQKSGSGASTPEQNLPIEKILPNIEQPRRRFSDEKLEELSKSIKEKGVIQPLIVRPHPRMSGSYEIIAGERRWRAAQFAQLHSLPAIVRHFDDAEVLEVAIIENIQRSDLNPVEEAQGYRRLMDNHGHTQEKMAEALGKSRSHIANLLRLLNLPKDVLTYLEDEKLSMGHARALITADDPSGLAAQVIKRGLSVRETERLAKGGEQKQDSKPSKPKSEKDADTKALEGDLSAAVGMSVSINHKDNSESGEILIRYKSLDQLDELCRILSAG